MEWKILALIYAFITQCYLGVIFIFSYYYGSISICLPFFAMISEAVTIFLMGKVFIKTNNTNNTADSEKTVEEIKHFIHSNFPEK